MEKTMKLSPLFVSTVAALGLVSFVGSPVYAQKPGKRAGAAGARTQRGKDGLASFEAALRAANLSSDQQSEIRDLAAKFREDVLSKLSPEQKTAVQEALAKGPAAGGRAGAGAAGGRRAGGGNMFAGLISQLNLTDEQKPKVDAIVEEATKKLAEMRRDASTGDAGKGAAKGNRQAMMGIMDDVRAQIRPLLTPEQQTTLDNYKPAARAKKKV
jgi:Spy/CpxP family protein refolding chaperone